MKKKKRFKGMIALVLICAMFFQNVGFVQANDLKITESSVLTENISSNSETNLAYCEKAQYFEGTGGQNTDGTILIATGQNYSTAGTAHAGAYEAGVTASGNLSSSTVGKLGSTRVGGLQFTVPTEYPVDDIEQALVTIKVAGVNGNLGTLWTKAALFLTGNPSYDVWHQNTSAVTTSNNIGSDFPAVNNDYSSTSTYFSKENIAADNLGEKTFDVTEGVMDAISSGLSTSMLFRLETVLSGFSVYGSTTDYAPTLTIITKHQPVTINLKDVDTGMTIKTITDEEARIDTKYSYLPEDTLLIGTDSYVFDSANTGNMLSINKITSSEHEITAFYKKTEITITGTEDALVSTNMGVEPILPDKVNAYSMIDGVSVSFLESVVWDLNSYSEDDYVLAGNFEVSGHLSNYPDILVKAVVTVVDNNTYKPLTIDGEKYDTNPANTFHGFGAVTANNSSRLLLDYKAESPESYWEIMNLLFNKKTGSGLCHVKIELGSDVNSSSGTEPSTMRFEEDEADVTRGAGWQFAADAKKINPDITVDMLRWGEPDWVTSYQNVSTDAYFAARYKWYKKTIDAAYETYGIKMDYISADQNETEASKVNPAWILYLRDHLDQDAKASDVQYDYSLIKIVASDELHSYQLVKFMMGVSSFTNYDGTVGTVEKLRDAIDVVSAHYESNLGYSDTTIHGYYDTLCTVYGKEIWLSEDSPTTVNSDLAFTVDGSGLTGTNGALDIANRFINGQYQSYESMDQLQPTVAAYYDGTKYFPKQTITANTPWSGDYNINISTWIVAHFMQFIDEGWRFIEGACYGDGTETSNCILSDTSTDNYMTCADVGETDSTGNFSTVMTNDTSTARYYKITVKNLAKAGSDLNIWETVGAQSDAEVYNANYYKNIGTYSVDNPSSSKYQMTDNADGSYSFHLVVKPYSMVTITSELDRGSRDVVIGAVDANNSASDSILSLSYADDFEYANYPNDYLKNRGGTPRYTTDQGGAFEVATSSDATHGNILEQQMTYDIIPTDWRYMSTQEPFTLLGDDKWKDYSVSIDFNLDAKTDTSTNFENYASLGGRNLLSDSSSSSYMKNGYYMRVYESGKWTLMHNNDQLSSGVIENFDGTTWHNMQMIFIENTMYGYCDNTFLMKYTATSNINESGKISIGSGYYKTQYDNLAIKAVKGGVTYLTNRCDDCNVSDSGITYSTEGWSHTREASYYNYNRTTSTGNGGSFTYTFTGTGINIVGVNSSVTLQVSIDGKGAQNMTTSTTSICRTSELWIDGLTEGSHTINIAVPSGTSFTFDSIETIGSVNNSEDTIEVIEVKDITVEESQIPKLIDRKEVLETQLPKKINITEEGSDTTEEVTVTSWNITEGNLSNIGDAIGLSATFYLNDIKRSYSFTTKPVVYSSSLVYLIDCGSAQSGNTVSDEFSSIAAAVSLKNGTTGDQAFDEGTRWGYVTIGGTKGTITGQGLRNTGYYASADGTIVYKLWMDNGKYRFTSGHYEWWANNVRTTEATISYTDSEGKEYSKSMGSTTSTTSIGIMDGIMNTFEVNGSNEGAYVTLTFSKVSGKDATVAFIAIEEDMADVELSTNSMDFGSAYEGYTTVPKSETVTATNKTKNELAFSISEGKYFNIDKPSNETVASNGSVEYTIRPKEGLAAGKYNETIVLGYKDNTVEITVSFEVKNKIIPSVDPSYKGGTLYVSQPLPQLTLAQGNTAGSITLDAGQILEAGTRAYRWTFTPEDTTVYAVVKGSIDLTVINNDLTGISITSKPNKTVYVVGDLFDSTGMVVTASYKDGTSKIVTGYTFSPIGALSIINSKITISYEENGVLKTAVQEITVQENSVVEKRYSITYVLNGGTNHKDNITSFAITDTVTLKNPTKKGSIFVGWYNGTNKVSTLPTGTLGNITLTAKWAKVTVRKISKISAKNSKKKIISISWAGVNGAAGYQITYSTTSKFKKGVKTVSLSKNRKEITKLIKNKTYYVKVRAYKLDSKGIKVYGKYSSVKKIKIKK